MNRYPSDLTTRERGVLQLAAEGLSNYEIADRVGIGRRNVAGVFADIYRKLGVAPSRTTAIVRYLQGGRYVVAE